MKGRPKFRMDETVSFVVDGKKKVGKVFTVDSYGTWMDKSDVSYDIMVEGENMLYKHIGEKLVIKASEYGKAN